MNVENREPLENFLRNSNIIFARKLNFLVIFLERLKPQAKEGIIPEDLTKIAKIISLLDPVMFLSKKELDYKCIILNTKLEELDREKIGYEIAKRLGL